MDRPSATASWRAARTSPTRLRELSSPVTGHPLDADVLDAAVDTLRGQFDHGAAGFGGAPKFPPSMVLEFLLRHHARTGSADALAMAARTCAAMARGGIYDQLGGGFARYSVDARWVVPHFEKMLYDNAQLLRVYTHLQRTTGDPLARRVALETAEFLLRDLRTDRGRFRLGARRRHRRRRGPDLRVDARAARRGARRGGRRAGRDTALGHRRRARSSTGSSTLQLLADPDDDRLVGEDPSGLLESRQTTAPSRPATTRSSPRGTAWPSPALADAGTLLDEPALVDGGPRRAPSSSSSTHLVDGRLRRTSRDGVVGTAAGVADDYGNLAEGLLALHQATGEARWLAVASDLLDDRGRPVRRRGRRFPRHERRRRGAVHPPAQRRRQRRAVRPVRPGRCAAHLLGPHRGPGDARARRGGPRRLGSARRPRPTLRRAGRWRWPRPRSPGRCRWPSWAPDPRPTGDRGCRASVGLTRAGHGARRPGHPGIPLLAQRPLVGGRAAAYVCRGFVCDAPVTDVAALSAALR